MEDLIIAGVSIAELKKQKQLIQKYAAKFIADSTERVQALVSQIVDATPEEAETLAEEAIELLDTIDAVSGVSGVEYYFDYSDEYTDGDDVLSNKLDALFDGKGLTWEDMRKLKTYNLYAQLEEMESTVRVWNASNC